MDQTEFLTKPRETAAETVGCCHNGLAVRPRSLDANFTQNIGKGWGRSCAGLVRGLGGGLLLQKHIFHINRFINDSESINKSLLHR